MNIKALTIAAVFVLVCGQAEAGSFCATTRELDGLNVRALQTKLMVGAIACGQRKEYNSFIRKFRPELQQHSREMQDYFARNYHSAATAKQDSFVTKLANNMSGHNVTVSGRDEFCDSTSQLFGDINSSGNKDLAAVSADAEIATAHGISPCANLAELSQ